MDETLERAAGRIFADHAEDAATLWRALEKTGLTRAAARENALPPADVFGLMRLAGFFAAPVALAETLLAARLLAAAGIDGATVTAGAAALDAHVARKAAEQGVDFTFLRTIPGCIGGAIRMNAGCYGSYIADVLISARAVMCLKIVTAHRISSLSQRVLK
jgi:hypothetical protein